MLSFQRRLDDEHTLVAINYGDAAAPLSPGPLPQGARLRPLYALPGTAAQEEGGQAGPAPILPPRPVTVFDIGR